MECTIKNREKQIENYINNLMNEHEKEEFEKHLFECDQCFNETRITAASINLIREEGNELFSKYLSSRESTLLQPERSTFIKWYLSNRWVSIPAAALLVFIAGLLVMHYTSIQPVEKGIAFKILQKKSQTQEINNPSKTANNNNSPDKKDKNPSISKKQAVKSDHKLIAEDFQESPNFENLISQEIRSNYSLKVISPVPNAEMKGKEIVFMWKTNLTENVFLEIYNNKEKRIYSSGTKNNQLIVENTLKPGLYYWKLENEENLLYVGKFLVK